MASVDFLRAFWPPLETLYGEFRLIRNGGVKQYFVALNNDVGNIPEVKQRNKEGWDVYFGVLPRTHTQGMSENTVGSTGVLWADIDAKTVGSKDEALRRLLSYRPAAHAIVDSGNGYHGYWFLESDIPFAEARQYMKAIASAIDGDAVYDAARVMRLPGTLNWKTDPPHEARLLRFDSTRPYPISIFTPPRGLAHDAKREMSLLASVDFAILPTWLTNLVSKGTTKGTRSEACFSVIVSLLRYGWGPEAIKTLFRAYPEGIGAKCAEKRPQDAERWLDLTIRKAQEVA